jgi:hypothetical protein
MKAKPLRRRLVPQRCWDSRRCWCRTVSNRFFCRDDVRIGCEPHGTLLPRDHKGRLRPTSVIPIGRGFLSPLPNCQRVDRRENDSGGDNQQGGVLWKERNERSCPGTRNQNSGLSYGPAPQRVAAGASAGETADVQKQCHQARLFGHNPSFRSGRLRARQCWHRKYIHRHWTADRSSRPGNP